MINQNDKKLKNEDMWVNMGGAEHPTGILSPFAITPHFCQITHTPFSIATHCSTSQTRLLLCFFTALVSFFLGCSRPSSQLCCLSLCFGMNSELGSSADGDRGSDSGGSGRVLDIYPLCCYYFGSKDPILLKDETLADRILRMKSNYARYGLRTCVVAVILVELFKHPHLLLLQVKNSIYKLPGGRLRPGESEIDGLKRKLSRNLSVNEDVDGSDWEVGECLGMWWRPDFETLLYPYLPPNVKKPKECTKLFLVRLPPSRKFIVPKNLKLLAIPLCQLYENDKTYGPIISGVPQLLSKFSFNVIDS